MCGIAGHAGPTPVPRERIERTLELMRHRGPDHGEHHSFTTPAGHTVDLLHTRLSIIDLEARSDQPFNVGSTWLVYNGELYNYIEVRDELARRGVEFHTEGDTEVITTALDRGGWDALDRCEGMWALASYDTDSGTLGLARDRFGEKPLYVYREGEDLYFGSEVKFIAGLLGRPLRVNHRHLHRYLVNGYKALYKTHGHLLRRPGGARPRRLARARPGRRGAQRALLEPRTARVERPLLRGGGSRHARAADPLGRAAPARRRAARLLHERRGGLDVADLDRQERLRLRRPWLHDRERGRAL